MSNLLKQVAEPQPNDTISYIYALCDPRNTAIRYVGKSIKPKERYKGHLSQSSLKSNSHKNNWIKELLKLGLKPELAILECVYSSEECTWEERERAWIARIRNIGGPKLTNNTDSGEGVTGVVISEEARRKRAERMTGMKMPPGTGAKISASNKGRKFTAEHRKNITKGQKNRWKNASEEDKKKMQNLPDVHLPEIRKKIVVGLRNVPRPAGCSSKYRGVTRVNRVKPWLAGCSVDNKHKHIGSFAIEEDAARARDRFILENFPGWNIELNFPRSDYQ